MKVPVTPETLTVKMVRDFIRESGGFAALTYEQDLDCQCLLGMPTSVLRSDASQRICNAINARAGKQGTP